MKYFFIIYGLINFTIFSFDLEYDKDAMTWLWLYSSVLWTTIGIIIFGKEKNSNRHE